MLNTIVLLSVTLPSHNLYFRPTSTHQTHLTTQQCKNHISQKKLEKPFIIWTSNQTTAPAHSILACTISVPLICFKHLVWYSSNIKQLKRNTSYLGMIFLFGNIVFYFDGVHVWHQQEPYSKISFLSLPIRLFIT